ncbi:MAG: response regulator [Candidatus Saccharimonadales bacterium]
MKSPILLIEDDQWLADSYLAVLRAQGHDVTQLSTAYEAMEWMKNTAPALIIADVLLGDHNSFTLFHELQSYPDTANIPVIVCTTLDKEQFSGAQLSSYGIVEVLDKTTMTPDQLLLAVETHVSRERSQ